MAVTERYFQLEGEEAVVHLPEKPNGFLVLILGDANHYVENKTSLWHQHPDRRRFIDALKEEGYTLVYSNQYGKHWGNDEAYRLTMRTIKHALKTEILNGKIHVFAEGMGALIALRMLVQQPDLLRSVVLYNPCLDLEAYRRHEKSNLFFYKRFMKELKGAYGEDEETIEKAIALPSSLWAKTCPETMVRIFHCVFQSTFPLEQHSRPFEEGRKERGAPVELTVFLPGKLWPDFVGPVKRFLASHEQLTKM
ncbi:MULTISPECIES: alpha/beta hydrolase family protein [Alteribacter]|uniref:Alpha/beta hydrolase n=1 Tax=Alteribacter keqinensis TaxID=2483800 RepID=A0A3M7TWR6_9BACI|nr:MULTISPECIES: alpha/beta hydrolase [Alteribacter]MBM7097888.1 alpha/beta hydrolase [Alteribacter salitolerans]RNA70048.1 alpha/beta hydrolase [Alteribacter keqinensis]